MQSWGDIRAATRSPIVDPLGHRPLVLCVSNTAATSHKGMATKTTFDNTRAPAALKNEFVFKLMKASRDLREGETPNQSGEVGTIFWRFGRLSRNFSDDS